MAGALLFCWGTRLRSRQLAYGGIVSLLIDAPCAPPQFHSEPEPLNFQEPLTEQQRVIDLRGGMYLLRSLGEVDPSQIAFVGRSFDAAVGGILAGVEHRFQACV